MSGRPRTSSVEIQVREVTECDRAIWAQMFADYRSAGGMAADDEVVETVWSWLTSASHETTALVAVRNGAVVGFAHVRPFARPITASRGLWLDDLFVAVEHRGCGVATALLDAVATSAAREGCDVVRWSTRTGNPARTLYDRVATVAPVVVYNRAPVGSD